MTNKLVLTKDFISNKNASNTKIKPIINKIFIRKNKNKKSLVNGIIQKDAKRKIKEKIIIFLLYNIKRDIIRYNKKFDIINIKI